MFFWKKNKKITRWIMSVFAVFLAATFSFGTIKAEAYSVNVNSDVSQGAWASVESAVADAATAISAGALEIKEYVLDGLAWTAANVLIDTFTDSIVDWINSGFEGSPMFVQDPKSFFGEFGNQLSGAVIDDLNMYWLCDPLGALNLDLSIFLPGTSRNHYECTFNDIADNFEDMFSKDSLGDWLDVDMNITQENIVTSYGSDFRNGGWPMWLHTSNPKNNKPGVFGLAYNDAMKKAEEGRKEERFGVQVGGGFLGMRKCVEYTPGTAGDDCLRYETTTPGKVVQEKLNKTLGGDESRLQVADEIDEILGALITQFASWIVTGGSGGEGLGAYTDSDSRAGDRDHYGALEDSQDTNSNKLDLNEKIDNMSKWEKKFKNALSSMKTTLDERFDGLNNILTKLNCISDDKKGNFVSSESCAILAEGVEIANLEGVNDIDGLEEVDLDDVKTLGAGESCDDSGDKIDCEINEVEEKISNAESKLGYFEIGGKYYNDDFGWSYVEVSEWALEVLDNFSSDMLFATSKKKINTVKKNYCFGDYDNNKEKGDICGEVGGEEEFGVKIWSEKTVVAEEESTNIYWYATRAEYCEREEGSGDSDWDLSFDESVSGSHKTKSFEADEKRDYSITCYGEDGEDPITALAPVSSLEGNSPVSSVEITASPTGTAFGGSVDLRWKGENVYGTCYLYSENKDDLSGFNLVDPDPWMDELGEGYYTEVDSNNYKGKETTEFEGEEGDDDYEVEYQIICHNGSEDEDGDGEIDVGEVVTGSVKVSVGALGKMDYTTQGESKAKDANTDANKEENRTSDQLKKYTCVLNEYTKVEDVDEDDCEDLLTEE